MAGLRDGGLRVPDDVSVIGMDGHFLSAISWPALTTVQLPVTEMAGEMVRRVMRQEGDAPSAGPCVFADVMLVERASVAPPPAQAAGTNGGHA